MQRPPGFSRSQPSARGRPPTDILLWTSRRIFPFIPQRGIHTTSQGSVTENGTTYRVCEYLVTNSTNGLVMGAWVTPNTQTVAKIFTYNSTRPDNAIG
jgi:hypothetical protein